jgi:oligosaccharide repeat unit polymerase
VEFFFDKLLSVLLSFCILWQGYVFRRIHGTWLTPAGLWSLFWFALTILPLVLLLLVPVTVNPLAIAYILVFCLVFSLGSLFFPWSSALASNALKASVRDGADYGSRFLTIVFWGATFGALLFLLMNSLVQQITLYDLVFNLLESSARYAQMRYSGEITANVYAQLSNVLIYVAVPLGGFVFDAARGRVYRAAILAFAFLPSLVIMVTQSARGTFFLAAVMFYAAILIARLNRGDTRLFSPGGARRSVTMLLVVVPIVGISFLARGIYQSDDTDFIIDRLIYYFASYSCGHLYAFSDWFTHLSGGTSVLEYAPTEPSYGYYTFMAVFNAVGMERDVPPGVFVEYFLYQDLLSSNIFTIYRGLILDFGAIGSLVFAFTSSLAFHLSFYHMLRSRRPAVTVAAYIFMVGYVYTSLIISLLIWNSVYAAFLLLSVILWCNTRLRLAGRPLERARRNAAATPPNLAPANQERVAR